MLSRHSAGEVLEELLARFDSLAESYDDGSNEVRFLGQLGIKFSQFIVENARREKLASKIPGKAYFSFVSDRGVMSRPVESALFTEESTEIAEIWKAFEARRIVAAGVAARGVYSIVQPFACAIDLYKRNSRKTAGTFHEVCLGTLLSHYTKLSRQKQIDIPGEKFKVPTDLVLESDKPPSLVCALKMTTRERVVQPWVHQKILNDIYGKDRYRTVIVAVSEMQLAGAGDAHEVLVPHQIGLYQKHIAELSGMYYLDVPEGYVKAGYLPVRSIGDLLQTDLKKLVGK